jgi:hypothetical protein
LNKALYFESSSRCNLLIKEIQLLSALSIAEVNLQEPARDQPAADKQD